MTDWAYGFTIQDKFPHSFNALQKITMAMQDYEKNKGKKTLFGRDKGLEYFYEFEQRLRDLLFSMVMDGIISRKEAPKACLKKLISLQLLFWDAFSGWGYAKSFFHNYFIENEGEAISRIESILK